jgi:hypothetical protein
MHPAIFTLAVLFTLIEVDNAENPQDVSLTTQCMPGAECDIALNFVQKGQKSERASILEQDMEAKTECSADFGEDKACCGQPGDWWAAENKYPNGLRNCPQNEPICDGYQEYLKMGICKAKTECSANFGETEACCGQAGNNLPKRLRNCPQNEPICHDYKKDVKMGICRAKAKIRCSADFGEKKACCGQPGDWWAAERKKIFPNGLRNCPQNQPICDDYKEYVKMGICRAKAYDSCDGKTEGQPCQQCDLSNKDCVETAVMKTCQGGECRPSKAYDSCDGKIEGQPCQQCDPSNKDCMETAVVKTCQEGECRPSKADFSCEKNTVLTLEKSKYPSGDLASREDLKNSKLCPGQVGKQCKLDFVNPSDLCKLSNGQVGGKKWRYQLKKKTRRRKFRCYIRRTCKPLEA